VSGDWSDYDHCVDRSILIEIFEARVGRAPAAAEMQQFQNHFAQVLERTYTEEPHLFKPIAGAAEMLVDTMAKSGTGVALATGGFAVTARLKLSRAGLELPDVPAAFADDGLTREDIIRAALQRAKYAYRVQEFERIVSVGDGVWDVRTAANLELDFVGIAKGRDADRLRAMGAVQVIPDYQNLEAAREALVRASVPKLIA
jgi:phosphoglycolate phosphatase-like HAD superfamily hydrolase